MTTENLAKEFEQSSGQLKSYLLRITAIVADAEDIVHDTYIRAIEKVDTDKSFEQFVIDLKREAKIIMNIK